MIRKDEKINVSKVLLMLLAAAGVVSVAVLAPNALRSLEMFYGDRKRKYDPKYHINKTIIKLRMKGFIKFQNRNGKMIVRLTKRGENRLLKYQLREVSIKKPRSWDKKWRVIIFDIKENIRGKRDAFRNGLCDLGFKRLQNSVWVYPYECEEVIVMLKSHFNFGKDVLYMIVENIENDRWLREEFGLS